LTYVLSPLTDEHAKATATWAYEGPWSVYDGTGEPMDPADDFWAVLDEAGELAGFACFGVEARVPGLVERRGVLDVGVGMHPDKVGRGRGREFAAAVLAHGARRPGVETLRVVVQEWNERSRRLVAGLGFTAVGTHEAAGATYVVFERGVAEGL
jgi:[ribosomal protein S18]-alanine N-acetyltransferase